MKKFAVIDCETDPFEHGFDIKPFVWGFFDGKNFEKFFSTKELCDRVKKFDGLVFAHNGGRFDFHFLLPYLESRLEKILLINGRIANLRFGSATLRDSYCLIPEAMGKIQKTKINYEKMKEENRQEYMEEILDYLRDDCVFLYGFLERYRKEYGTKITLAANSLNFWIKNFGGIRPKTNKTYFDIIKPFYHGGRCEVFKRGHIQTPIKTHDINSAYPWAMMGEHPISSKHGKKFIEEKRFTHSTIKKSFVDFTGFSAGAFPVRKKSTSYPIGDGRFFVTGHELEMALELGLCRIDKINRVLRFDDTINFAEYVSYFYNEKIKCEKNGDKVGRTFAKIFMNSLYGKFSSNYSEYEEHILCHEDFLADESYIKKKGNKNHDEYKKFCGHIGNYILYGKELAEEKYRYLDVAVSASITGQVRALLMRSMTKCTDVYYCDTDSIFCRDSKLTVSDKLGDWKDEGTYDEGWIAGKKLYSLKKGNEYKTASKGVELSHKEIVKICEGHVVEHKKAAPTFSVGRGVSYSKRKIRLI